ncbi:Hypothetical predicted protein, partial [Pelobates cultripes]
WGTAWGARGTAWGARLPAIHSKIYRKAYGLQELENFRWQCKSDKTPRFGTYRMLPVLVLEVQSLYQRLFHSLDGIRGADRIEQPLMQREESGHFLLDSIHFILSHNFFSFNEEFYLQLQGTAMGTKFAPSYANIFLDFWEKNFIWTNNPFDANLVFWRRYIDDILFIWKGSESNLLDFINYINSNQVNLIFSPVFSQNEINFLDLTIFIEDEKIKTKTFFKPTDANSFINTESNHHPNWLRGVPRSQFTRIRRNCTDEKTFLDQASFLKNKFLEKGYANNFINKEIMHSYNKERGDLLINKEKQVTTVNNKFAFSFNTQYNTHAKEIKKILNKHWPLLLEDDILKTELPLAPQIIFRKGKSFKNVLAPSTFKNGNKENTKKSEGFYTCGLCKSCHFKNQKFYNFCSSKTKKNFKIKEHITCNSTHVVYLLTCGCGTQYVGRTIRPVKKRFLEHFNNIKNQVLTHSVPVHCIRCQNFNPSTFSCVGIEKVSLDARGGDLVLKLRQREGFWIHTLKTMQPEGMNVDFDMQGIAIAIG